MRALILAPVLAGMLLGICSPQRVDAAPTGNVTIVNTASATYSDTAAHHYGTVSNTISTIVAQLSAIVVSPKEAAPNTGSDAVPAGTPAVRTFTLTNTSNITDAYQIGSLAAGSLKVLSVQWLTPSGPLATGVGGSLSPAVNPGGSIVVQITLATVGMTVGSSQSIVLDAHTTASGTANGTVHDTGTEWIVATTGPALTGPDGKNSQISKMVNAASLVQRMPGTTANFSIALQNSGGAPAQNVVISDPVPAGLAIVPSSAQINGAAAGSQAAVSGQTIAFTIPSLAAGASVVVSFTTTVPSNASLGVSFLNVASVSALNIPVAQTTPAVVLSGSSNIVFDGLTGGSLPIVGAVVSLLDAKGAFVDLSRPSLSTLRKTQQSSSSPLASNANPYVTGSDGSYGFALLGTQIGSGGRYYLTISASGYLNRRIAIDLVPTAQNFFYDVVQVSMDGQPLAAAGGFALTRKNVALSDVFGLFGNLPLFPQRSIVVTKTVDKQAASAGDALSYTIVFENASQASIGFTNVNDVLPTGLVYVRGSARVDRVPFEPKVDGRTLTWSLDALPPGESHTITYAATIFGSVAPGADLTNSVSVVGTLPGTTLSTSGSANVTVRVLDGALTPHRIVTGRVFLDATGSGHFKRGDTPLAGVRVLLEDGSFALTDSHGLFSFPSVRPGEHVLRLDPLSIPLGVRVDPRASMTSPRALQRLLHGLFDDATMEDIQFALEPSQ